MCRQSMISQYTVNQADFSITESYTNEKACEYRSRCLLYCESSTGSSEFVNE